MSSVLPSASEKPRYVAEMFGRIARRYDLMNTIMTAGQDARWRRRVAEAALSGLEVGLRPRVLDVGAGTGKVAEAVVAANPRAQVVALDFTEPMLRRAGRELNPTRADALRLPFADAAFDAVVGAFVLRNLADIEAGIREQVRVLRPGGRLVVLETTPGPRGRIGPLFRLYFRYLVPLLGGLIAGDARAYTYLPESTRAFVEPSRLAAIVRERGLEDVRVQRLSLGTVAITLARRPALRPA